MFILRFLGIGLLLLVGGGLLFWQHPYFETHRQGLMSHTVSWAIQPQQWTDRYPMAQGALGTLGDFANEAIHTGQSAKTVLTDYFFPDLETRKQRTQASIQARKLQQKLAEKQVQMTTLKTEISDLKQAIDTAEQTANPAKKWLAENSQRLTRWIPQDWGHWLPLPKEWSWPFSSTPTRPTKHDAADATQNTAQ